jgi:DNA-binding transcriptional ArsR family regulator
MSEIIKINGIGDCEKIFHEPKRLLIVSVLCATYHPLTFNELKKLCDTSDGNLHRHLKVLEEDGMIAVEKRFVDRKPLTTIALSIKGVDRFEEYIEKLERVVKSARKFVPAKKEQYEGYKGKLEEVLFST